MAVKVRDNIIKLLNSSLGKESVLKKVEISFIDPQMSSMDGLALGAEAKPTKFSITFPKYLKHLQKLKLKGVHDPNFSETMFDMASASRLKQFSLGLVTD